MYLSKSDLWFKIKRIDLINFRQIALKLQLYLYVVLAFKQVVQNIIFSLPTMPSRAARNFLKICMYTMPFIFVYRTSDIYLCLIQAARERSYRGFHEKGTFSVHSFNDDYLSIPERPGSYKYLFHEIPVISADSVHESEQYSIYD